MNIRKSATLIIASALETKLNNGFDYKIMLLKRSNKMKVLPGFHVFPGGKYDAKVDESKEWLSVYNKSKLNGMINKNSLGNLVEAQTNAGSIPFEASFRLCAIRETFEETGLLLATEHDDDQPKALSTYFNKDLSEWHDIIKNDSSKFLAMCLELKLKPDIFGLHEWANWITPPHEKFRFNTFFFTCFLPMQPASSLIRANTGEIESLEVIISLD